MSSSALNAAASALASAVAASPSLGSTLASVATASGSLSAAAQEFEAYLERWTAAVNATPADTQTETLAVMLMTPLVGQLPSGVAGLFSELTSPDLAGTDITSKVARAGIVQQIKAVLSTATASTGIGALLAKIGL